MEMTTIDKSKQSVVCEEFICDFVIDDFDNLDDETQQNCLNIVHRATWFAEERYFDGAQWNPDKVRSAIHRAISDEHGLDISYLEFRKMDDWLQHFVRIALCGIRHCSIEQFCQLNNEARDRGCKTHFSLNILRENVTAIFNKIVTMYPLDICERGDDLYVRCRADVIAQEVPHIFEIPMRKWLQLETRETWLDVDSTVH